LPWGGIADAFTPSKHRFTCPVEDPNIWQNQIKIPNMLQQFCFMGGVIALAVAAALTIFTAHPSAITSAHE
jgi:hypothetical protein